MTRERFEQLLDELDASSLETLKAKNAKYFDKNAMESLIKQVLTKVQRLCKDDLAGEQKYIKNPNMMENKFVNLYIKLGLLDTSLNSSGRMKKFMQEFNIKSPLLEYDESMKKVVADLKENGRYHKFIMHRLIDTDGKVYHMNYARFIPTEIQLNLAQKNIPAPKLSNMTEDFVLTNEILNRPEVYITK